MLCQKCGLKEAVVHVVCVVNDKQIDKWLCSDCVEELAPSNFLSGTVFNAKEFLDGLLKPKAREEQIMNRFTERAKGILEDAMRFALDKGHDHVGTEHILLALLNVENCFAKKILEKLGIDNQAVIKELESWMEPAGSTELMISYTPRAKRALELAGEAAAAFKLHYVGSEHLLLGLLREGEGVAAQVLRRFNVTAEQVMKVIKAVYDNQPLTDGNYNAGDSDVETKSNVLEMLSEFGRNFNQLASDGKIDPVVGREKEVERIIQILCRRTKNNPVLIGESGVGKTAIAEGLAQRIVDGNVPEILREKIVFSLEIGYLVAGTKYRGEFEERLKELLEAVKENKNIILFIDELHTIIGAGAAEGAIDAANIIKPALARGEMQAIGATTLNEYRKNIEKDAALERRFQPIVVGAPDVNDSIEILKGLRDKYEAFHRIQITDEAIMAAVRLSDRYITDRNLPDKAIDLMDEACSRVRLQSYKISLPQREIEQQLEKVRIEKESAITQQMYERAAELRDAERKLQEQLDGERQSQRSGSSSKLTVSEEDVAEVVASWTNIPLRKLTEGESKRLIHLEEALHERVVGQNAAVDAVAKAIRRARAGFKDKNRPVGSFLFLGPTGVGKTELAKALAENLFGDERALIRFDMSEYMEKHTTSRLVGAPPGYVGYEEGGQLTDVVRRRPYSVILLDEIEKAHPDVFNLLLQIMEDGRLTDGQGRTVDFKNAVIIMTSNAGARALLDSKPLGFATGEKQVNDGRKSAVLEEVKRIFRPEFLNRIDEILVFDPLGEAELRQIVEQMLKELSGRLQENGLDIKVTDEAKAELLKAGKDTRYGARPLRRALRKLVEDPVSDLYLASELKRGDTILTRTDEAGKIYFDKEEAHKEEALVAAGEERP